MNGGTSALRNYLVGPTVDHAVRETEHYARTIGQLKNLIQTADDLPILPLLNKQKAAAAGARLYASAADDDMLVLSSGTTRDGAALFVVRRCAAEAQALQDYLLAMREHAAEDGDQQRARTLVLSNVHHGLPEGPPGAGVTALPWLAHPNALDLAVHALRDAAERGRPYTVVRGSVSALMAISLSLARQRVPGDALGVRLVGTNSYELTARSRRIIGGYFGSDVVDNYSLSELPTWAMECKSCGAQHFDGAPVVAELVDLDAREDSASSMAMEPGATGRLVLTGLLPYVQRTPLIRYDTGDVVTVAPPCHARADFGLAFRGRARSVVAFEGADGRRVSLFPSDLYRCVDPLAGVARAAHPLETMGALSAGSMGPPKARARARGRTLHVEVEFAPQASTRTKRLACQALHDALRIADPVLRTAEDERVARILVRAVDRLPDAPFKV